MYSFSATRDFHLKATHRDAQFLLFEFFLMVSIYLDANLVVTMSSELKLRLNSTIPMVEEKQQAELISDMVVPLSLPLACIIWNLRAE